MATDNPEMEALEHEMRAAARAVREVRYQHRTGQALPADKPPYCSFCGAGENNVERMLAGSLTKGVRAHICDSCVEAFYVGGKKGG